MREVLAKTTQVLEVCESIWNALHGSRAITLRDVSEARQDAVDEVSTKYGHRDDTTVREKIRRGIDLKSEHDFDRLVYAWMTTGDPGLQRQIKKRISYPDDVRLIDKFFEAHMTDTNQPSTTSAVETSGPELTEEPLKSDGSGASSPTSLKDEVRQREPEFTMDKLQAATSWDRDFLEELCASIRNETQNETFQVIFAGPPGTGKTWVAKHIIKYLTQHDGCIVRKVQFHPSYSYEEFMEGLRPIADEKGVIRFDVQPGVVVGLVREVEKTKARGPHIVLMDEINRANLPKVLGELMYLFEYRGEEIDLQYSKSFILPRSIRFIGTMNTADRSIRSIDSALRRRFEIIDCPPRRDILKHYFQDPDHHCGIDLNDLLNGFDGLNKQLTDKIDKYHTVGHTFFMKEQLTDVRLRRIWDRQLNPLIEEYFFDRPDLAREFKFETFWPNV